MANLTFRTTTTPTVPTSTTASAVPLTNAQVDGNFRSLNDNKPENNGTGATGTWPISITGSATNIANGSNGALLYKQVEGLGAFSINTNSVAGDNYLTIPSNSLLKLGGSGAITIECWIWLDSLPSSGLSGSILDDRNGTNTQGYRTAVNSSGQVLFQACDGVSPSISITSTSNITAATWVHIAVVRQSASTNFTLYLNGTAAGSYTGAATPVDSTQILGIGYNQFTSPQQLKGKISNLRIVKGTAVYTSNFTPAGPLTAITNTTLLTARYATIIDGSTNNWTITTVGTVPVASGTGNFPPVIAVTDAIQFLSIGTNGRYLTSNGTIPVWVDLTLPTGLTAGSASSGFLQYSGTTATAGQINGGTTAPTNTTRLNYEGNFYATNFYGNGSNLTSLTAGNLSGTIPSTVLANSSVFIGTTSVALNRASASLSLAGVSIDGNAGTVTNGVYTTGDQSIAGVKTLTGPLVSPRVNIERVNNAASGISWYNRATYTSWADYMAQAGQASVGPTGNITAPSGNLVTSWGLRSFIENAAGYGWTWESGTSAQTTPTVVAEIRSSDGAARFGGTVTGPNFADSTGTYNVNIGSGGSEGRGIGAGYSGGSYAGIGYNIRHTATADSYIAPSTDTVSYLRFDTGGFRFFTSGSGAAGRSLSLTTGNSIAFLSSTGNLSVTGLTVSGNITATGTIVGDFVVSVISTNTTAVTGTVYILTSSLILTLPASPTVGDWVRVSNRSGTTTAVIARNGQNIMSLAEDMTVDTLNATLTLVYASATLGWTLI